MEKPRTIREIIKAAGGAAKIAEAIQGTGAKLGADAVYQWPNNGIPDRYWSTIITLANSSPAELFAANESVRAGKAAA